MIHLKKQDKFRYLRTLEKFKSVEKNNYIIFTDSAKQYRCAEIAHFYLIELAKEGIRVSFNFFAEQHGKVKEFFKIFEFQL